MVAVSAGDAVQLTVGALVGFALFINMSRHGLSVIDPATRWPALAVAGSYLFMFLALADAITN